MLVPFPICGPTHRPQSSSPAGGFTAERLADAGRLAAFEEEVEAAGRRITGIAKHRCQKSS